MPMVDVGELKEWVENWFYMNRNYHPYSKSNDIPIPELYDILERMPSVDVVRCGECKHRYVEGDNVRFNVCELSHNRVQSDDWFCADGERKSDLSLGTDNSDRCVCCGAVVPEGRMVCPVCERRAERDNSD